ncbi:hypothetical protein HaLaN_22733, partial [Haematococcus lacustris]
MGAVPIGRRILFELDELYYPIGNTKGSQVEARFKTTIQHILDGRYPWMQVPRPNDMRKVHEVLQWWLEDAGQMLQRTKKFATSAKATVNSFDLDATDKSLVKPLLCETLPFNLQLEMLKTVMAKGDGDSSSVGEILKADFVAWAQLGSLRGHQEQQWSMSTAKTAVVNRT